MNRNESRELREQRAKIIHDMHEIATSSKAEDRERWKALDTEQSALEVRIAQVEKSNNLLEEATRTGAPPAGQPNGGESQPDGEQRYEKAFSSFLKYGASRGAVRGAMGQDERELLFERRDMGTGGQGAYPNATTGFFVPVGFVHKIEEALKFYGSMLDGGAGMPEIMATDTGQPLPYPTDNDTTVSGELIGEGQQVSSADVSISQIVFGAYKFSSKLVKVSIELMQDSAFDLDAYLVRKFATRLGRILNTKMTNGAGTTEPFGIVTQAVLAATAAGASSNDGNSSEPNTIGSDDLTTLEHSVDPLYRPGAKYMFHDLTLAALKKVKDKYGRPLWMNSIREGEPDTINGYRYSINNDMDQLQTQSSSPTVTRKTVLFGALDKYLIRRVKEMSVLRLEERFADFGQIAFIAFARYDGNLLDAGTHPVKYLQNVY